MVLMSLFSNPSYNGLINMEANPPAERLARCRITRQKLKAVEFQCLSRSKRKSLANDAAVTGPYSATSHF